jgi:Tol biopolymer transport system component
VTLKSGTTLGPYKIAGAIGAGGMGEVYQAHDTKLGRDVAIKVLAEAFAHDPDRLSRFQREAKMLAALNHPNIATIHGLEQSNGTSYLVMELVSGETLQQRLAREGRLPIEEALGMCRQIAEALEAAHEKSIIHRDLKPANVKVTSEGKVKVLDFGLAKAFAGGDSGSDPSNSPTLSAAGTMQGVILGTAAYMSPEQARGKVVDKRTDIWAFGCVLYELLTGKQAFQGDTVTEILAAVLRGEPDWAALPAATPTKVRDLLRHCLQKDKTLRVRDAGDAGIELHEALAAPSVGPRATGSAKLGLKQAVVWGLAGMLVALVTGLVVWTLKPAAPPAPKPVMRFTVTLPPGQQLADLENAPAVAISPDGTHLAYVASQGGTQQIYLRAMDSLETKSIPGTDGAVNPFFSPDGQGLGFFAGGRLKKVSVSGGAALPVGDVVVVLPLGASWGSQGMIAFGPSLISALQQVSDVGGMPQPLTHLEKGEANHRWPEFLPAGKAVLFAGGPDGNSQVAVQSVSTGKRQNLIPRGTQPLYALSGHLIYAQGGNLMAVPFDPERLVVTGATVPVVEGVAQSTSSVAAVAQYGVSATGSLIYVPGGGPVSRRLVWVDRKGLEQALTAPAHAYRYPRLSPHEQRVAVTIEESSEGNIWIDDLARGTMTPLTHQGNALMGAWTPDGKRIAFVASTKEGPRNAFWQWADGSGGLERLTRSEYTQAPNSWSPDGQRLALLENNPITGRDIWMLRISDREMLPFLRTPFNEAAPQFSPDGRWLAYISDESGRDEIYAQPYPGPGQKWPISTDGGTEPVWNRNGHELFYRSGQKMMAVDIITQSGFTAGKPHMLFEGPFLLSPGTLPNYDVSPDGQHFLMLKPTEPAQAAPTQINVVLNWFEELKQKVPVGFKK